MGGIRVEIARDFDAATLARVFAAFGGGMIVPSELTRVYLALGATDMRKQIDGLARAKLR